MRMLVISPVVDCAVGCSYCHAYRIISRNYKGSERSMSFESFRVVMEKIPDDIHLNFGGFAEAWLNPECTKMVMTNSSLKMFLKMKILNYDCSTIRRIYCQSGPHCW